MQKMICSQVIRIGSTGYEDDGELFGVCPGQSIKCRQRPNAESDHARSGAVRAGITFRRKGAIKLITAIDLLYIPDFSVS